MKYKTLFRVLLKLLGVYFFVTGIAWTINQLSFFALGGGSPFFWTSLLRAGLPLVQSALGLYLFFGGKWIVDKAIPGNRPYCQECGYDLTGAVAERCTECGTPFKREDVQPAGRDETQ